MKSLGLLVTLVAVAVLGGASMARASLTGEVYQSQDGSGNTDVAPTGTPTARFTVSGLDFDFDSRSDPNGYEIGPWLGTGGATGILYANNGVSTATMDNVTVTISGNVNVYTGEQFSITQDDALTVTIGGVTLTDVPGPNSPTSYTVTYTGPTGSESMNLEYAEIDGAPAVLDITPVPEPTTMLAGAMMLLPFGTRALRSLRKNRAA